MFYPITLPMPKSAPPPAEEKLPRLIFCDKCGCTYLGKCPNHTPEEGHYKP